MKTMQFNVLMWTMLMALACVGSAGAKSLTVKGKVTDAGDGASLIGCSVQVAGARHGTISGVDGGYTIQAGMGDVLVFTHIGYVKQEVKVTTERLDVVMQPDNQALAECVVASCSYRMAPDRVDAEEYASIVENTFKRAVDTPLSTFSMDVDAASYSNMRRFINGGELPPADAIRTEELVNYFTYNYAAPTGDSPVSISMEAGSCPWNPQHRLVRIGLKAKEIPTKQLPASNLVFLIDVSGSMWGRQRLDLVKASLKLLVNNLREKDRVAIVVYSGAAGEKLAATPGSDKEKIREAIDDLEAGGSTAGGEGIRLAYKIAKKNFMKGGNNRVILCTDGDFNVGVTSEEGLEKLIEQERKSGVFLTVLGYGMGNYKDNRMQVLADKGNGNAAYIDGLQEANRVLVNEFGATLHTVAKDVKLQVEFNPATVQAYRLIGYESRLLNDEDFNNDAKDAGDLGAGHTVTAFYEVIPVGAESGFAGKVDDLKYRKDKKLVQTTGSDELLTVKMRYKAPDGNVSRKMERSLVDDGKNPISSDFRFASAVAMFGQLLRNSDFKGEATYDKVISLAKTALDDDERGYRREFIRLVETAKGLE